MSETNAKQLPAPQFSGAERAAMVLRELGEDTAAMVLREMDEATVNRISVAMTTLKGVAPTVREDIMLSFANDLGFSGGGTDGMKFLSRVLVSALGETQAREILERLTRNERRSAFQLPPNADPRTLAMQVAHERPQTIALLLAHIPHEIGANLLTFLPEPLAAETMYRFSTLDVVSPGAVVELREMLDELMSTNAVGGRRVTNLGGAKQTAEILNRLQSGMSDMVLGAIDARDAETAEKIRENLFTFIDLGKLPDRSMQILLREVPSDKLAPALRLVDDTLRAHFFQNLSTRQVEILKEELRSGPPMRRSEALTAQSEVVEIALKLAGEGRISINASEEMV
ncbi:MAG: flagellar motor switch protein FliG [Acidocella sp. 20-63-7]|nr:MAG: flagellar motor switch protein FliG [Acidocella sp. 20-63-7]HQT46483.1 flagellar motor switch protein FliG [Acidocella sp.]